MPNICKDQELIAIQVLEQKVKDAKAKQHRLGMPNFPKMSDAQIDAELELSAFEYVIELLKKTI